MTDDEHGCPNCDPEHAPKTEAAQAWLEDDCWGRGHYHPYVEHDFHETAAMLIKVEHEAAAAEREWLRGRVKDLDAIIHVWDGPASADYWERLSTFLKDPEAPSDD